MEVFIMPVSISAAELMESIVPITKLNQGGAGRIIDEVRKDGCRIIVKNNVPVAVILSPEEYKYMEEEIEDYRLLLEAQRRLKDGGGKKNLSEAELLKKLGVSPDEIDSGSADIN
jgi:antitoxin StbD